MIGWVLLSREAVARAEEALASEEKGVRDEVGFLSLHQNLADRFFPGTSVLHTRLRYVLFVPWLIQRVVESGNSDLTQRLAAAETALARQLIDGSDSDDGIIGRRVWPRPSAQPPSMSYWSALGAWGILRPRADDSMPSRTETLRRLAQSRRSQRARLADDDGSPVDEDLLSPFVILPPTPKELGVRGEPLDFALVSAERAFLRKQLLGVRRAGAAAPSLLARLTKAKVGSQAADLWSPEIAEVADEEDRRALVTAQRAAALAGIGRAIYAALTELVRGKDGLPESTTHRTHLHKMIEVHGDDARAIDLSALEALLPSISDDLSRVLSETRDWLVVGNPDPTKLYQAYETAEGGRKGLRARLPNNVAGRQRRAEWDPHQHPRAEPLHYRWPNVRRLLADLFAK